MVIFYTDKTSSIVKGIEETCSMVEGHRCPSARTQRPGVTKTERHLDHLQDQGEEALTDLNLKVFWWRWSFDRLLVFGLFVCLPEGVITTRCQYDTRQTAKINVLKVLDEIVPVHPMTTRGEVEVYLHSFYTSAWDESYWSASRSACIEPIRRSSAVRQSNAYCGMSLHRSTHTRVEVKLTLG